MDYNCVTEDEREEFNKKNEKSYLKKKLKEAGFPIESYPKEEIKNFLDDLYNLKRDEQYIFKQKSIKSKNRYIWNYIYKNKDDYQKDLSIFLTKLYNNTDFEFINNRSINLNKYFRVNYNKFSEFTWYESDRYLYEGILADKLIGYKIKKEFIFPAYAIFLLKRGEIKKDLNIIDTIYSLNSLEKYIYNVSKKIIHDDILENKKIGRKIKIEKIQKIKNFLIEYKNNIFLESSEISGKRKELKKDFLIYIFKIWDSNILNEEIECLKKILKEVIKDNSIKIREEQNIKYLNGEMLTSELFKILKDDLDSQKDNLINLKLKLIKYFLAKNNIKRDLFSLKAAYSAFFKKRYKYKKKYINNYIEEYYSQNILAYIYEVFLDLKEEKVPVRFFKKNIENIKAEVVNKKLKNDCNKIIEEILIFSDKFEKSFKEEDIFEIIKITNDFLQEGYTDEELKKQAGEYYKRIEDDSDFLCFFYERIEIIFLAYFKSKNKISIDKNINQNDNFEYHNDYDIQRLEYNEIIPIKLLKYFFELEKAKETESSNVYSEYIKLIISLDEVILKIRTELDIKKYEEELGNFTKKLFLMLMKDLKKEDLDGYLKLFDMDLSNKVIYEYIEKGEEYR